VIKTGADQIIALPATCTHLRCILQWEKESGRLVCPCHAGAFDLNGNVVAGPPPRPLQPLKVEIRGGIVYVNLA
jgi:cytochrome b6-f complex iron-sulfur subunit